MSRPSWPATGEKSQLWPEGRNARGGTRLRDPEILGPLVGLGIRPLVSAIRGLGNPLLGAPWSPGKALRGPGAALKGASERGVRFQRSGKTSWGHSEASKRPRFPGCPLTQSIFFKAFFLELTRLKITSETKNNLKRLF